ncbi:MAG: putative phosphohistidine phosphatase SixA [Pseudomonadota bacterium]|jgi:phosphohistidine phosphatase
MRYLTLIRHALANQQQAYQSDKERSITQMGRQQIENIAVQLQKKACFPDYFLCSPALRTVQTAEILCQKLNIDPKVINLNSELYSGDLKDILCALCAVNTSQQFFLIGHNPTLSCLAHALCPDTQSITLPTAGVISLKFNIKNWDDLLTTQGELLFFMEPAHEG